MPLKRNLGPIDLKEKIKKILKIKKVKNKKHIHCVNYLN